MAGNSALFRVTTAGQTESTVGSSEKIEFNSAVVPDSTGLLTKTSFNMSNDISFHPNPRRSLDQVQDGLLGTMEVILAGSFSSPSTTAGPVNLFNWMKDPKTNSAFKFGRFGIRTDDFPNVLNLTPSGTIGYMLYDIHVEKSEDYQNEVQFIAKLWRNGSI